MNVDAVEPTIRNGAEKGKGEVFGVYRASAEKKGMSCN
jgi:hypothetical protein